MQDPFLKDPVEPNEGLWLVMDSSLPKHKVAFQFCYAIFTAELSDNKFLTCLKNYETYNRSERKQFLQAKRGFQKTIMKCQVIDIEYSLSDIKYRMSCVRHQL